MTRRQLRASFLVLGGFVIAAGSPVASAVSAGQSGAAPASVLSGFVKDVQGTPIAAAMVTVVGRLLPTDAVTVYSDQRGAFKMTSADLGGAKTLKGLEITCKKLGYQKSNLTIPTQPKSDGVDCTLIAVDNVADDVPASAWLGLTPDDTARHVMVQQCVQCHQLPWSGAKTIAAATSGQSQASKESTWHNMVTYMREMSVHVVGASSRRRFQGTSADWRSNPARAFLSGRAENILVPFLAKNLPTDFSKFSLDQYVDRTPVGVTAVIKEFKLKADPNSWDREVVATTSPYIWGIDLGNSNLLKLSPRTGEKAWRKIPGAADVGPHTITAGSDGNIWVSLEEVSGLGIFNPKSEKWLIYKDLIGRGEITHDFATNANGKVGIDVKGRAWLTVVSENKIAAFNPTTAKAQEYQVPARADGAPEPTLPYGMVMTSDRKHVWFSQHAADVIHEFNAESDTLVFSKALPQGAAPRRMSIDDKNVIWIALSGSSQLMEIDAASKQSEVHDLPDRASSPYNATWDPVRKVVWVGTTNADKIYCFDPIRKEFTQFPLPTQGAFLRMLSVDPKDGHIWTTYANKLGEVGPPPEVVELDPGVGRSCR